jgi:hypothetical protein
VSDHIDIAHVCLIAAMTALLLLPASALWLMLRELTLFYFHAQHVMHDGREVFTPRFTLTGIRLPSDELRAEGHDELARIRSSPGSVELLVPGNEHARTRIDRQLDAYGGLGRQELPGDLGRATGLFELAASRDRALLEEVAKIEHGMARHILRLQVIVLRYVKALLAFLLTALAVFTAAGVLSGVTDVGPTQELWLVCITALWAPSIVAVATSPVRWLDQLLRAEGARSSAAGHDPELTKVERISVRVSGAAWVLVTVALIAVIAGGDADRSGVAASVVTVAAGGVALWWQILVRIRSASVG